MLDLSEAGRAGAQLGGGPTVQSGAWKWPEDAHKITRGRLSYAGKT